MFLAFQSPLIGSCSPRPYPHNTPMDVILIVDLDQAGTIAEQVIVEPPTQVRGVSQVVLRVKVLLIAVKQVQHCGSPLACKEGTHVV